MISIYALINPLNNHVFYIGASADPQMRLYNHRSSKSQKSRKTKIVIAIQNLGLDVEMIILDTCHLDEVRFWEEFYIELFFSFGYDLQQTRKSYFQENKVPNLTVTNKGGYDIYSLYGFFRGQEYEFSLKQSELCISNTKIKERLYKIYQHKIDYAKSLELYNSLKIIPECQP